MNRKFTKKNRKMANKPIKKGSPSLTIKKIPVTTIMIGRHLVWGLVCKKLANHCCLYSKNWTNGKAMTFPGPLIKLVVAGKTTTWKSRRQVNLESHTEICSSGEATEATHW